jgi:hypothetical protein
VYTLAEPLTVSPHGKNRPELELLKRLDALMDARQAQAQNHRQIVAILQNTVSQIGSVQFDYYFRAGRSYFTINHAMGHAGNLFFKSAFDNLLKGSKEKPHVVLNPESFCIIFRI